ncbi:cobyric acid synthase [Clostridium sp.]
MAKAIMIQGTMSNAGKSLLAAGLCRIFKQDGYRVAPFKSQNMALNSYITSEGLEMGRAQVVQAQAAGCEPSVDMNPILLKPSSDVGSQVIVRGVPIGTMPAKEYFKYKKQLIPEIKKAFQHLSEQYDIIVIEGAGSPAEINLKSDDIVNMGMARMAGAPVLLAGDIDRGGVFAQLYGTVALLEPDEQAMVKGLIINKFRGDKTILDPGVEMIEKLCNIPVVGVVPYMDVDIEDEDSLSSRLSSTGRMQKTIGGAGAAGREPAEQKNSREQMEQNISREQAEQNSNWNQTERNNTLKQEKELSEKHVEAWIDIAAIRFPRLSNFTDLNVFDPIPGVSVRYVSRLSELGRPDLIVLPGTKNTIEDLLWMRQNGLEAAVLKKAAGGTPIWGICGGYQMMGQTLSDQEGTEAGVPGRTISGMGLLPLQTQFQEEKTRTQVKGRFGTVSGIFSGLSGMEAEGYEIHMGETSSVGGNIVKNVIEEQEKAVNHSLLKLREEQAGSHTEKQDGCCQDNLYGTYVHGIFDKAEVAETIVRALMKEKGMEPEVGGLSFDYEKYREEQYNRLADTMRKYLDMEAIYRILEEGV